MVFDTDSYLNYALKFATYIQQNASHRIDDTRTLRVFTPAMKPEPPPKPPEAHPPVGALPVAPPKSPLVRTDSRSFIPPQQLAPRPAPPFQGVPPQQPPRPQFQTGGPVNAPPQLTPRPGSGQIRGPVPGSLPQQQPPFLPRAQVPLPRPSGPQSFAPQQPRPGPPPPGQYLQRAPPPTNLQFGPRQPPLSGVPSTPEGPKQQPFPPNGANRPTVPPGPRPTLGPGSPAAQLSRQSSQASLKGLETLNANQNKQVTLETLGSEKNVLPPENGVEIPGAPKGRSYSIAAAPGAPSPLKMEADRRQSVSSIGGRFDELSARGPSLGLIQESKTEPTKTLISSGENVSSLLTKESENRPDSRLTGSKMSESFIGDFNTPKKKDDDDDVVLHNNSGKMEKNKAETFDRSPSLSRSDSSPEPKPGTKPAPESILTGPKSLIGNLGGAVPEVPSRTPTKTPELKPEPKTQPAKVATPPVKTPTPAPVQLEAKSLAPTDKKPPVFSSPIPPNESRKTPRNTSRSATKTKPKDGDNDSGVDESTQGHDNGSPGSPTKKSPSKIPSKTTNGVQKPSLSRSSSKSATAKTPENPPPPIEKKKVPMNKVQVGNAPSPNIKAVKSKIGSLDNTAYKPGGGKIKIENRKLEFNAAPKIAAKNDTYQPGGGDKKITQTKLQWNAKSKIGSLENAAHKPGGGDKKIETVKLEFKDRAKPKVASTINITHKPGGGAIKIENQKLEFKAQSKVGSLDNVKHKPGGGDVKIFDDKDYIRQMSGQSAGSLCQSGQESPLPPEQHSAPKSDENLNQQYHQHLAIHTMLRAQYSQQAYGQISLEEYDEDLEIERPLSRCKSARYYARSPSPPQRKLRHNNSEEDDFVARNNEKNKQYGRPKSARDSSRLRSARAAVRRIMEDGRPPFRVY